MTSAADTGFTAVFKPYFTLKQTLNEPLEGYWLYASGKEIKLVPKPEAVSLRRKLEHFFGYGPYGFHTIHATVETIASPLLNYVCSPPFTEKLNQCLENEH